MFQFIDSALISNSKIYTQFAPFLQEGSKLPSFCICFHSLSSNVINSLEIQSTLADFIFYKETADGFWISFCGSFLRMDKSFDKVDVYLSDQLQHDVSYSASYLLMQAYMYRLVSTKNIMIHSAAVVYKNNGILFCGLSGAGKSTQANLWKKYLHCSILNYDKPCVICDKGSIYIHGSPWSGKEELFINDYAPLKAIVYVVQAKKNSIRRLKPAEAMSLMYLHNYVYPLSKSIEEQYLSTISTIAEQIPVYELSCDISETAVEVLYNELFCNTYQEERKEIKLMYPTKYKVNTDFMMKKIVDEFIVLPRGKQALNFKGAVVFNEAGAFLWEKLQNYVEEEALVQALQNQYGIDSVLAKKDTKAFLTKMKDNGLLDIQEG